MGVKYQLTNWLLMLSERKLNQTCAGFSDHCVNGTTCDPVTKICVTEDSKCCLYAIPGVLSTPFLCLCPTLSRSLLHRSICICLHILICSGILSSCCNASPLEVSISFPHAQWYAADAEVKVLYAENQALRKIHSVKSDSATMEVGMFGWCQEFCLHILLLRPFRFIQLHFVIPIPNWI